MMLSSEIDLGINGTAQLGFMAFRLSGLLECHWICFFFSVFLSSIGLFRHRVYHWGFQDLFKRERNPEGRQTGIQAYRRCSCHLIASILKERPHCQGHGRHDGRWSLLKASRWLWGPTFPQSVNITTVDLRYPKRLQESGQTGHLLQTGSPEPEGIIDRRL